MEDRLYYAMVYFVEAVIAWQYFPSIFQRRQTKWKTFLVFLIGYGTASQVFQKSASIAWRNTFLFVIINCLILWYCFNCTWKRAVFHSILLASIMTATELIVLFPLGLILDDFTLYLSNTVVRIILFVMSKLFYLLSARLCVAIVKGKKENDPNIKRIPIVWGSFLITSLLLLLCLFYISVSVDLDSWAAAAMIICSLLFFFSNILVVVVYQYIQNLNKQYLSLQLTIQKDKADDEYYNLLKEHYEDQRVLIHDIRKHLETLRHMADKQKNEEVVQYISDLESLPELRRKVRYCDHSVLNAVLTHCASICEEKGIAFFADVRSGAIDFMAISDITALLGNLLENATEAAENADPREINLNLSMQYPQNVLIGVFRRGNKPPVLPGEDKKVER